MSNSNNPKIRVAGPEIGALEVQYVIDAVKNGWYENADNYINRFEQAFAEYLGVKYAVCVSSCTAAIHLSLLALGISEGDEVIVPDITWIGTSAPIDYVGADIVFADIEHDSWCLSPKAVEQCLTPRTKAIIPVHLYGTMANMQALRELANAYNLKIIEDAAEAIGSTLNGKLAGSFGDTAVFSFHGSKTVTTGEGGMLVTNDVDIYKKAVFMRDHGRNPGDRSFFNLAVAYKYKMGNLQAALGLGQLQRVRELVAKKRQIFNWYRQYLAEVVDMQFNIEPKGATSSYWMSTIIIPQRCGVSSESLQGFLSANNIDTRPFFHPLSSIPAYQSHKNTSSASKRNKVAYGLSPYGINLPSALNLTEADVAYVSSMVIKALNKS